MLDVHQHGRFILLNSVIAAQWEGMGDVELAMYELALRPPCPTIKVLKYS